MVQKGSFFIQVSKSNTKYFFLKYQMNIDDPVRIFLISKPSVIQTWNMEVYMMNSIQKIALRVSSIFQA